MRARAQGLRVFLDANILFSAAKSDGAIRALLRLLQQAGHECVVDGYVVEEARRNLITKAPAGAGAVLEDLVAGMEHVRVSPVDPELAAKLPLPPKDRPVLAAAIRHRCAVLVTGDRTRFGRLFGTSVQGVTIHSARSIVEVLFP